MDFGQHKRQTSCNDAKSVRPSTRVRVSTRVRIYVELVDCIAPCTNQAMLRPTRTARRKAKILLQLSNAKQRMLGRLIEPVRAFDDDRNQTVLLGTASFYKALILCNSSVRFGILGRTSSNHSSELVLSRRVLTHLQRQSPQVALLK